MARDLFEHAAQDALDRDAPLARRVAPRTLDEIAGQDALLGPGKILRRAIEADRITSLILFGPPGSGKTALARIIAARTAAFFEKLNAVTSGVKDVRDVVDRAKQRRIHEDRRTILFIDEIHRFNRAQQDALLPDVESGNLILIGATTENPFFSVVSPLLSRSLLFEFQRLSEEHIIQLLDRALSHPQLGFEARIDADAEAKQHIARYAEGDARRALNALEIALRTTAPENGVIHVTPAVARESIQQKLLHYDGTGDEHYDAASAFIKSIRGTDPDSAVYWLARMLEAGDDPRFVARRLCIAAAEDIGNADPQALTVATSAHAACEFVGMPEARIILAQATTYLACAPKSNASYLAIEAAIRDVRGRETIAVPMHLRDGGPRGPEISRGTGYAYPHEHPDGYVNQHYGVARGTYYTPTNRGKEREFKTRLDALEKRDASDSPRK